MDGGVLRTATEAAGLGAYRPALGRANVQTVVASLASDKNVRDAVLKNDKVMEFYSNHQSSLSENIFEESPETNQNKSSESDSKAGDAPHGSNGFTDFVNRAKVGAMEMVNNVPNFIQDIFATKKTDASSSEDGSSSGFQSFITPKTFYAVAVTVIMCVLFKRVR